MFMSGQEFRESLRAYQPDVHVNGREIADNRRPGRCCDSGCMVPGTSQRASWPRVSAAPKMAKGKGSKASQKT